MRDNHLSLSLSFLLQTKEATLYAHPLPTPPHDFLHRKKSTHPKGNAGFLVLLSFSFFLLSLLYMHSRAAFKRGHQQTGMGMRMEMGMGKEIRPQTGIAIWWRRTRASPSADRLIMLFCACIITSQSQSQYRYGVSVH